MQEIGSKVHEMNDHCRAIRVQGDAGAGLVKVEVNGLSEILQCKIDPSLFAQGDCELLEDMIVGAANQALENAKEKHAEVMRSLAGTMELPDLDALKGLFGSADEEPV